MVRLSSELCSQGTQAKEWGFQAQTLEIMKCLPYLDAQIPCVFSPSVACGNLGHEAVCGTGPCGLTSLQTPLVTLGMGITQPPSSLLLTQRPPSSPLPNANANLIFPTCFHTPVPWSNTFCGSPFNFSLHYICPIKIKKQLLTYSTLEFT